MTLLQLDLMNTTLLIILPGDGSSKGVVVEEPYFVEWHGILPEHIFTRYRHSGWGTLFDDQGPLLHTNIHRQPIAPARKRSGDHMNLGLCGTRSWDLVNLGYRMHVYCGKCSYAQPPPPPPLSPGFVCWCCLLTIVQNSIKCTPSKLRLEELT